MIKKYSIFKESTDWNKILHEGTWTGKKLLKDNHYYMDFEKIKLAVNNGADVDSCETLSWAVRMNNFEVTKFMLENGANVNYQNNGCKWTPLMSASDDGYVEIAKLLIDYNANPFIGNFQGFTTLDVINPNTNAKGSIFSYEQASKDIQRQRDKIRDYLYKHSIYMISQKYNL